MNNLLALLISLSNINDVDYKLAPPSVLIETLSNKGGNLEITLVTNDEGRTLPCNSYSGYSIGSIVLTYNNVTTSHSAICISNNEVQSVREKVKFSNLPQYLKDKVRAIMR